MSWFNELSSIIKRRKQQREYERKRQEYLEYRRQKLAYLESIKKR